MLLKDVYKGYVYKLYMNTVSKVPTLERIYAFQNVRVLDADAIVRSNMTDANSLEQLDAYGVPVAGSPNHVANIEDRTVLEETVKVSYSKVLKLEASFDNARKLGWTKQMFETDDSKLSDAQLTAFTEARRPELQKQLDKHVAYRQAALSTAFVSMIEKTATGLLKPLGYNVFDTAANRPDRWNYTNVISAAGFDENALDTVNDLFQKGQKTVDNHPYGSARANHFFTSGSPAKLRKVINPDRNVQVDLRTSSNGMLLNPNLDNAIMEGSFSYPDHEAVICLGGSHTFRLAIYPNIGDEDQDGFVVRHYVDDKTGTVGFETRSRFDFEIESPIDIAVVTIS